MRARKQARKVGKSQAQLAIEQYDAIKAKYYEMFRGKGEEIDLDDSE